MIQAIKAMQTDERKTGIKDNAVYEISIGNFKSLKAEHSKGRYLEDTSNARASYFKDMMFPRFMRKREGFPTDYKTESLIFIDGKITGLFWTFTDGSHMERNL